MSVQFCVLGPVKIASSTEEIVLHSARLRGLLAAMLMEESAIVPRSRLAAALWNVPPKSAGVNLRTLVSQLRSTLDRLVPGLGDRLTTLRSSGGGEGGYRLSTERNEVDCLTFRDLACRGRAALTVEDYRSAVDCLRAALALWYGPAGHDAPSTDFLESRFESLNQLRLTAAEDCHLALLRLGDLGRVLPDVHAMVAEHPLRERSWSNLLRALYLDGQPAYALSCYDRVRTILGEELGVEPSSELQALHVAILRRDTDAVFQPALPRPEAVGPTLADWRQTRRDAAEVRR